MTAATEKGRRGTTVATPAALKLVEGRAPGRDSGGRRVKKPPAFRLLPPERPADLSPDAAELWDEIVAEMSRLDLLKPLDGAALQIGCETFARWKAAVRRRREDGMLATSSQGLGVAPWVRIEESASREYRAWCAEFGLTPAATMRLATGDGGDGDDNPFAG